MINDEDEDEMRRYVANMDERERREDIIGLIGFAILIPALILFFDFWA